MEESKVLTVSGLLTLLSEIEQLKGLDIGVSEDEDSLTITIGDDVYHMTSPEDSVVEADDSVIDSIEDIDYEGWDDISDIVENTDEPVEGGIIKELIKTLAIGGLVRLTKNAISES